MWILTPKLNRNLEKKITVTNEIKFVDGSEKKKLKRSCKIRYSLRTDNIL